MRPAGTSMSAEPEALALAAALLFAAAMPAAADDSAPDAAFLEYLGSWEGSDEEWVALLDEDQDDNTVSRDDQRSDPAPGDESQETEHES